MVGQILPNNNKSATGIFPQNISNLNQAQLAFIQFTASFYLFPAPVAFFGLTQYNTQWTVCCVLSVFHYFKLQVRMNCWMGKKCICVHAWRFMPLWY
jgi:hypothetical protein